jgi:hypothetical protein
LPQQSPTLLRGLEGGNPLCVFLGKFFTKKDFLPKRLSCLLDYIDNRILQTGKSALSGKVDRAKGLLRLRDTDTSLITFREKQLSLG